MPRIELTKGAVEVALVPWEEFYGCLSKALYAPPVFGQNLPFESYIQEKRETESALRRALATEWVDTVDFAVGADENIAFTMCGGIYSHRVICREYLDCLHRILHPTRYRGCWAYSTAVELEVPLEGMTDCDFVLKGDRVTVLDWGLAGFDFVQCFSRTRVEAAAQCARSRHGGGLERP